MINILITLLRAFYWISVPLYLLLYFMASKSSDFDAAFWFEGGRSRFGPASFYVLISIWAVPALIGIVISASGHPKVLTTLMLRALVLSLPCIPGFLLAGKNGEMPMVIADPVSSSWLFLSVILFFFLLPSNVSDSLEEASQASIALKQKSLSSAENARAESSAQHIIDKGVISIPDAPPQPPANHDKTAISRNGHIIMKDVPFGNIPILLTQGTLQLTDHYWINGMTNWLPLSTMTKAQSHASSAPKERKLGSALLSLFVSWVITVLIGALILALLGYGNSGTEGAGRLIGAYIGLLIFVRPLFFVIEIISRAIMGKRGVELLAP